MKTMSAAATGRTGSSSGLMHKAAAAKHMADERKETLRAPALQIRGVSHKWGTRSVLAQLDFTLEPGELKIILGPNGAGKTTLFSLIAGLLALQDGEIRIFGNRLADGPATALARLGVVFQDPSLDIDLTVHQNLAYHGALHGLDRRTVRDRGDQLLGAIGLLDRAGERVRSLSGGHKRRVEVARALLHRPDLLILDEPTTGLDIPTRSQLIDDIHELARTDEIAVLWATHLIDEVKDGDRVLVLHNGRIKADAATDDILSSTGTDDLSAAFGSLTADGGQE